MSSISKSFSILIPDTGWLKHSIRTLNFSLPNDLPAPLLALNNGTSTAAPNPPSPQQSYQTALPIGAKIGIGLVVSITVLALIAIIIYYWRRLNATSMNLNELHGQYVVEKLHELQSPREIAELNDKAQVVAELPDDKAQVPAELPAEMWETVEDTAETSSLKELDTNERLDVIHHDARSRRRSDEIRTLRKHELEMIRTENKRENTRSPLDKLINEIKLDDGVHRPSDDTLQLRFTENFGRTRLPENKPVETPNEENSLDRVMTPEPLGQSRPLEWTNNGYPRSPISPVSFA